MPDNETCIAKFVAVGYRGEGQNLGLEIRFDALDKPQQSIVCPYPLAMKFADAVRAAAMLTRNELQQRQTVYVDEIVDPYTTKEVPHVGTSAEGQIVVRHYTREGIPVTVAMTREHAAGLRDKLTAQLAVPEPHGTQQ